MPDLSNFPDDLSLIEAVAWIVLRDVDAVAFNAALARPPPFDQRALAWCKANEGWVGDPTPHGVLQLIGLDMRALCNEAIDPLPDPLPSEVACAQLLAALREGRVRAQGRWQGAGETREIVPADWRAHALGRVARENNRLAMLSRHERAATEADWRDVVLAGADMLREWPPRRSPDEAHTVAREERARMELEAAPDEPLGEPARGFVWADAARRLVAFGDADCRCPNGMDATEAWAKVGAASRAICDALASAPDGTATGLPAAWDRRERASVVRRAIPASFFSQPCGINGHGWAVLDVDALPMDLYVTWRRSAEPADWADVLLPLDLVKAHVPKPSQAALVAEMKAILRSFPAMKQPETIRRLMDKTGCTKREAEAAKIAAQGGERRQGKRPRTSPS